MNGLALVTSNATPAPSISLAEHDRTIHRLLAEIAKLKVERAHSVEVLTAFKELPLSIASAQLPLNLLDDLLDGPKELTRAENL